MRFGATEETVGFSDVSFLRACNSLRTYADSLPLGSNTGAAAGRALVAYGENLVSRIRASAGGQLPPRQNSRSQAVVLSLF